MTHDTNQHSKVDMPSFLDSSEGLKSHLNAADALDHVAWLQKVINEVDEAHHGLVREKYKQQQITSPRVVSRIKTTIDIITAVHFATTWQTKQ
jgi:hypothetical protein